MKNLRGYTLVELVVAVGLFALIMTLVSGAYIVMIDLTRRAQGAATGIDNLSFALETMTRSIRTGTDYHCGSSDGGDCTGGTSFYFTDANGADISYSVAGSESNRYIQRTKTVDGTPSPPSPLTDPSVHVSSLMFYVTGTAKNDQLQPQVTIVISGTVSSKPGELPQSFTVETGATMRVIDL